MKKTILIASAAAAILFLSECAEKKVTAAKSESPADEVAAMKTKYSPDQIAKGKTISEAKCGECHDLHAPQEFTVHEWDKILPGMSHKAKLSADDAGLLRSWIIINAKQS
jgi:cytochrome c5